MVKTVICHGVRKWRVLAKQVTYTESFIGHRPAILHQKSKNLATATFR